MKHLDLFSGIGGAALAVDAVWPDSEHTFCEIDPYCKALLKLRFPTSQIHGDIRTLRLDSNPDSDGCTGGQEEINPTKGRVKTLNDIKGRIDILTGGFPCQPFSQAGKRKGTADDRHLWPEMLRVIREFKPRWVVGENVAGLVTWSNGLVLRQIFIDLEAEGYEIQAFVIPAVAVNAPHRRDRVWIVANRNNTGNGTPRNGIDGNGEKEIKRDKSFNGIGGQDNITSYPKHNGIIRAKETGEDSGIQREGKTGKVLSFNELAGNDGLRRTEIGRDNVADGSSERLEGSEWKKQSRDSRRPTSQDRVQSESWERNWTQVAAELCGMDDGLRPGVDRPDGYKLSASRHRAERLKGLGNAWVPQVAIEILKGIKQIDENMR